MQQGICPICGSTSLDYGEVDFYDDQCLFPRECGNCGAEGEEWYSLDFCGHENIQEKNQNEEKAHN